MIEAATYNLIFIMSKMNDINFQLKATIAIRKATHCRVRELLDAFVAAGLIESIVKIINNFGQKNLREISAKSVRTDDE